MGPWCVFALACEAGSTLRFDYACVIDRGHPSEAWGEYEWYRLPKLPNIFHAPNEFSVLWVRKIPIGWKALQTVTLVIKHRVEKKIKTAGDLSEVQRI